MTRTNTNLEDYVRPPRKRLSAVGCLTVMVLLVAIVLLILAVSVRSQGGGEWIAGILRKKTGLDLMIGEARLGLPFDLVMKNVQARQVEAYGGFKAAEIRMGLRLSGGVELGVKGAELDLVKTADGWLPAAFERIAVLNDVRETPGLFVDVPRGLHLNIRDSGISWGTPDGEISRQVRGLELWAMPLESPGRRMWFYELFARDVKRAGGVEGRNVRRCWMSAADNPYVEIVYRPVWRGGTAIRDWWSVPAMDGQRGAILDEK